MNPVAEPPTDARGAAKTIVVVEDEVLVRLEIADYLRDCGYQVIEANNADEALEVLRSDTAVDLVFSDIQMPGSMDGFGLARWIREHQPGTRVILTSGIVKSAEAARDLCEDGPMMQKPYHHNQVVQRIRALLAGSGSRG
jgi:CheY-like chemotaxis protein